MDFWRQKIGKRMKKGLLFIASILLLASCAEKKSESNHATDGAEWQVETQHAYEPAPRSAEEPVKEETEAKTNVYIERVKKLNEEMDKYEDGYEDGAAFAEEDRIAGKPGMQAGGEDDEDDDDYEDGFDDGYE